jgi:two-component system response regulator RegA
MLIVRTAPPDFVLLDLNLPVTDGIAFLRQFRDACADAPVVIITGFGSLESARSAIRLGVSEFLSKPCDLDQLEQAISRAQARCAGPSAAARSMRSIEPSDAVRSLAALEREAIIEALRVLNGNRSEAARRLGISRRSLHYKLEGYRQEGFQIP